MKVFNADEFNAKFLAFFSVTVVIAVLAFVFVVIFSGKATGEDPMAMLVIGSLLTVVSSVISYWFGSSAGSKRNADRLSERRLARRATDPALPVTPPTKAASGP